LAGLVGCFEVYICLQSNLKYSVSSYGKSSIPGVLTVSLQ
jgi:hypothetical protein